MEAQLAKTTPQFHGSLPLVVTLANRKLLGFIVFLIAAGLYMASNRLHIFEPQLLTMTPWDQAIPFVPWTVWIYTSEYTFFVVVYLLARNVVNLNKYVYAILALQIVSVIIFWLWPTTYPRELYPLPSDLDSVTYWVFNSLRTGDTPANCCPSLHVSSVFLCSFLFREEQKGKFPFFITWATLIGLSTLTTKQHYIIDVVTGLGMALLFHWIFYRKISYRAVTARR